MGKTIMLYHTNTRHPVFLKKKSDSKLMRLIGWVLSPFTATFMERFWTTIGHTIYTPTRYDNDSTWGSEDWLAAHPLTVEHEVTHVRRNEAWSLPVVAVVYLGPSAYIAPVALGLLLTPWLFGWSWVAPIVVWHVAVLLAPLSIGLAYGRWYIEREAYLVQVRGRTDPGERERVIAWIADSLWDNYLWTWPRSAMRRWLKENA